MNPPRPDITDPIDALCAHAWRTGIDDLPALTVAHQKRRILDNLAALSAGLREPGCAQYLSLATRERGREEATVLGLGYRTTLRNAAVINSIAARALDYCDVIPPGYHPSSTDVPVALGVAEAFNRSGADVLVALAAGQDVAQRINLAAHASGWMYNGFDPNILGNLSGAIVAGRLAGCTEEQLRHAVGLAFSGGAGTLQMYQDKVLGVRIAQGNATRNALDAALLALDGVTGTRAVLAGENGFFRVYAQREPDLSLLLDGLGREFRGREETCFKPYPCCGLLIALVDGGLAVLAQAGPLAPRDITAIRVSLSATANLLCGQAFEPQDSPQVSAMFSAAYVIASVLIRGSCRLEHFQPQSIMDAAVLALTSRVSLHEDLDEPRFDAFGIHVSLADGRAFHVRSAVGRGWPEKPLSDADLESKLRECLEFSKADDAGLRAKTICAQVTALEKLSSVDELLQNCVTQQA